MPEQSAIATQRMSADLSIPLDIAQRGADANDPELDLVVGGDRISSQRGNRRKQKRPAHG